MRKKNVWKKGMCLILTALLGIQCFTANGLVAVKAEETQNTEEVKEEVLEIATLAEFKAFAERVNKGETFEGKTVRLVSDIAFDGVTVNNFKPIGDESHPFKGNFDGGGHSISGMIMVEKTGVLFYKISSATVQNLILKDCEFDTSDSASGITCYAENSKIENCKIEGNSVLKGVKEAAGIVGYSTGSQIKNCSVGGNTICSNSRKGNNSSNDYVSRAAGIVCTAEKSSIINCNIIKVTKI